VRGGRGAAGEAPVCGAGAEGRLRRRGLSCQGGGRCGREFGAPGMSLAAAGRASAHSINCAFSFTALKRARLRSGGQVSAVTPGASSAGPGRAAVLLPGCGQVRGSVAAAGEGPCCRAEGWFQRPCWRSACRTRAAPKLAKGISCSARCK